jgi:chemotaxis protein methyltransferase CheR
MNLSISDIDINEDQLKRLKPILQELNVDIASLKRSHLIRRIRVRMLRSGIKSSTDYVNFVTKDRDEQLKLKLVFSINVTRFFRNIDTFDFLNSVIIPKVIQESQGKKINVWSAGCAAGAEPYSLAILFNDFNKKSNKVIITASDYNHELLSFAKLGIYTEEYFEEIRPDIKNKYFTQFAKDSFKVKHSLLPYLDFKLHNIVKDKELHSNYFDIVVCRNVLIYFNREQQPNIFNKFYNALKPNGYLILGRTESMPIDFRDKFETINTTHRVFKKKI